MLTVSLTPLIATNGTRALWPCLYHWGQRIPFGLLAFRPAASLLAVYMEECLRFRRARMTTGMCRWACTYSALSVAGAEEDLSSVLAVLAGYILGAVAPMRRSVLRATIRPLIEKRSSRNSSDKSGSAWRPLALGPLLVARLPPALRRRPHRHRDRRLTQLILLSVTMINPSIARGTSQASGVSDQNGCGRCTTRPTALHLRLNPARPIGRLRRAPLPCRSSGP